MEIKSILTCLPSILLCQITTQACDWGQARNQIYPSHLWQTPGVLHGTCRLNNKVTVLENWAAKMTVAVFESWTAEEAVLLPAFIVLGWRHTPREEVCVWGTFQGHTSEKSPQLPKSASEDTCTRWLRERMCQPQISGDSDTLWCAQSGKVRHLWPHRGVAGMVSDVA